MFDKLSQQNIRIIQDSISPGESTPYLCVFIYNIA